MNLSIVCIAYQPLNKIFKFLRVLARGGWLLVPMCLEICGIRVQMLKMFKYALNEFNGTDSILDSFFLYNCI